VPLRMSHFVHTSVTYVEYPSVCGFGPAQYQLHIPLQATESAQAGLPGCATPTCISGRRQAGAQWQRRARKRGLQAAPRQIPLFLYTCVKAEWMESERRQKGGHRASHLVWIRKVVQAEPTGDHKGVPHAGDSTPAPVSFRQRVRGPRKVDIFVLYAAVTRAVFRGDFRKSCLLEVD
jgi:hypothetical protein